jgi:hypothetical protein
LHCCLRQPGGIGAQQGSAPKEWPLLGQAIVGAKKRDYPTEYNVRDTCGHKHTQCNCIIIVTVKKVDEQPKVELEVNTGSVNFLGLTAARARGAATCLPVPLPPANERGAGTRMIITRWTLTMMTMMTMATAKGGSKGRSINEIYGISA